MGWGALSAVGGCIGFLLVYTAMQYGALAVAEKVKAALQTLVPFVFGIATGERPKILAIIGVLIIVASVAMLSLKRKSETEEEHHIAHREQKAFWMAFAAGIAFGLGVVPLSYTTTAEGLSPLVSYRIAIALCIFLIMVIRKEHIGIESKYWPALIGAGAFSAAGDACLLIALQKGQLSLVPALAAISPGFTAILGWVLSKQHLRRIQISAIGLGLIGLVLIKL